MSAITEKVDAIFSEWDKSDSPGCALAVIKGGEIIYKRGYGMADLERDVPISSESLFDIGSTGKQFTTTVIAILENRGLLSFDDSLRKYVPEMPGYAEEITIRHLIHHTSGLREYVTLMMMADLPFENFYPEQAFLDLITRQRELNFEPGDEHLYSNSGYFMLGIIAQRITGKPLTELIREYIYKPLGMLHSAFNKDHRPILKNRALSYVPVEGGGFSNEVSLIGGFGDGPVYSSVDDLYLWDQHFYANKLTNAQPDLMEILHTQGQLKNGTTIGYAFGLYVDAYRGLKTVSHGGSWVGYRSELMRFPEQRFSVICLCNLANMEPEDLARRVADIYLEDQFSGPIPDLKEKKKEEKPTYVPVSLTPYTGRYKSEELNTEYFLTIQSDQLYLQRNRFAQPEPLQPVAPDTFRAKRLELCFADQGISVALNRVKNVRFEKQ